MATKDLPSGIQELGQTWPSIRARLTENFDRGRCDQTIAPLSSVQSHPGLKA